MRKSYKKPSAPDKGKPMVKPKGSFGSRAAAKSKIKPKPKGSFASSVAAKSKIKPKGKGSAVGMAKSAAAKFKSRRGR